MMQKNIWVIVLITIALGCQSKQSELITGKFETYKIDVGNIETFVPTEGYVIPANEVLLLSPAASIVAKIVKEPGHPVKEGDVIVKLDTKSIEAKIEQLNDQLAVKENNLEKNRLNARSTRADLAYNEETKKLKIASIKSTLADQKQLLEVGGISQAKYDKTKQELVLAEKDLKLVREKNSIRIAQLAADEKGLLLQIEMQQKELGNQKELLGLMEVKAPSDGIVLSVNAKEGEKIQGEKLLVTMSDLSRLKIRASIDSKFKNLIKTGRRAYVLVDKNRLEGRVASVNPQLENNNLGFTICLTESDHPKLIPNQKVNLEVVKRARYDVLRIKRGSLFNNKKNQKALLVSGDSAVRKEVTLGLITDEFIEVKEGLKEGDEIVISSEVPLKEVGSVKIEKR
ncbi:efflux RND transporter periplasmic adaptor subunit [Plebeiibacterium marinum]|uniref:Efflux RND transporter periplasmic adaptor subunit n=1 Tax=Plebeiibacterium marinum TaxID=2992111 RepID=A0AAE3MFD4_9BACT|nr:HlyD family efflux transporter periplasmic adaptor subunit [Plebeiobacterium marinum]MCW3806565.1 efflux RND transporter periplasmic adaptor subunit [Plebeiobacterium marinum]